MVTLLNAVTEFSMSSTVLDLPVEQRLIDLNVSPFWLCGMSLSFIKKNINSICSNNESLIAICEYELHYLSQDSVDLTCDILDAIAMEDSMCTGELYSSTRMRLREMYKGLVLPDNVSSYFIKEYRR